MEKNPERRRKSKGSLSVLDEFTGSAGSISFAPKVSPEVQQRIDEKTQLADAPIAGNRPSPKQITREEPGNRNLTTSLLKEFEQETVSKPLANQKQATSKNVSKSLAEREQTVSKPLARNSRSKPIPLAVPLAEREQTVSKPLAKCDFDGLVGKEKDLVVLIFEKCQASGSLESPILTTEELCNRLEINAGRLRNLIFRVGQKQALTVSQLKKGRASQRRFTLSKDLFQQVHLGLTVSKPVANREQTVSKPLAYPLAAPSSSSRNLLLIEESTTTGTTDELSAIDLTLVQPFGITTSVLARCVELYPVLQRDQLENLVYRFAEFMKDPKNKVQNARGFFISLAGQASKGQIPLDHIETPDERLMRLFVERQREAKARRVDAEQAALVFECESWLESLTSEMKLTLVPESQFMKAGTAAHQAMLKRHFTENVWPDRRKDILGSEPSL